MIEKIQVEGMNRHEKKFSGCQKSGRNGEAKTGESHLSFSCKSRATGFPAALFRYVHLLSGGVFSRNSALAPYSWRHPRKRAGRRGLPRPDET